jgi:hypothetical protein
MSNDEPRDLLAAFRADRSPPSGAADRSWSRLSERIAAGEPAPSLADAPVPADSRSRTWAFVLAAAAVALIAARLLFPDSGLFRRPDSSSEAPYQRTTADEARELEPRTAPAIRTTPWEPVPEASPTPAPDPEPAPAVRRPAPSSMPSETSEPDLARQLELVRAAARAVREGDGAGALRQADDYLSQYPRGAFVPEARLARVEALCRLARPADAARDVAAFVAAYPESPLRARVESACPADRDDGSGGPRPSPP